MLVVLILCLLFQEKGSNEISLKAMGRAINKTVMITELIKVLAIRGAIISFSVLELLITLVTNLWFFFLQRRVGGLHQNTYIGSTDITDTWEPLEEGLKT